MAYQQIRTLAFRLAPELDSLPYNGYTLAFPQSWKPLLVDLQAARARRPAQVNSIPIRPLNAALRVLAPDLVHITPWAGRTATDTWLMSGVEMPVAGLLPIVQAWVRSEFPQAAHEYGQMIIPRLRAEDLAWQSQTFDLVAWGQEPNGTASAKQGAAFDLLPDFLAAQLSAPGVTVPYGATNLTFRRVVCEPGEARAELMSWPPLIYPKGKHQWMFSVTVRFTVQTLPFQPAPVVHCDIGLRRWVSVPQTGLGTGQTSLYLLTRVPWIEGLQHSPTFGVAGVQWEYIGHDATGKNTYRLRWADTLAPVLADLQLEGRFPDPNSILANPTAAVNRADTATVSAAFVHSNDMKPNHVVLAGLLPVDRYNLSNSIADVLRPWLVRTDSLPRVDYPAFWRASNPFFPKIKKNVAVPPVLARRTAIMRAVGPQLRLEIWYQSAETRNALVAAVAAEIGGTPPPDLPGVIQTPQLAIEVVACPLGALGRPLDLPARKPTEDQVRQAMQERMEEISEVLPIWPDKWPGGAFVELAGKNSFKGNDPKDAIRLGFAGRGRLTQFVMPPDQADELGHRARLAFLDLLRQLGVQGLSLPDGPPGWETAIAGPLHYVGLWLIKQGGRKLPVLVHLPAGGGAVRVLLPGHSTPLSYPQALLALGQAQVQGTAITEKDNEVAATIRHWLLNVIAPLGNVLLLVDATNSRQRAWTGIANKHLSAAGIVVEADSAPLRLPGVRLVRVRGGEAVTPEWYAEDGKKVGFSKGLFVIGEPVFASTQERSSKFQTPKGVSK